MPYSAKRALELLRLGTSNPEAKFHQGQEQAIQHIMEGRGRLLVVQKTGWGKSFVYFIATKLLREQGEGPALLISPLIALMRNQIRSAAKVNVLAVSFNYTNKEEWDDNVAAIAANTVDIVIISPEQLNKQYFKNKVLTIIADHVSLLVIDEAHCISDWGHDFRPDYRRIERMVPLFPPNLRLLGTTATANNRVMDDLKEVLGPNLMVSRGDLNRPSLMLQTIKLPNQAERMAWLASQIPLLEGHGIIYTLTVRDAKQVANWLHFRGIDVECYTGETGDAREGLENALLENRVKALVATTALGMGFDKPDLAFVIHYQCPGSVVAYYQQVGRAGRAMEAAYGVLLSGDEEKEITEYFIKTAFPTRVEVSQILEALDGAPDGLSIRELEKVVNISNGRIDKALLLLSLESPSPIAKQDSKWQLTSANLNESFWERAERLTKLREYEQTQMQEYVDLKDGHMAFLIKALDGDPGRIRPPQLPLLPITVDPRILEAAIAFLRRTNLPIKPRELWPGGGLPHYKLKGHIPTELQAQPGKSLCYWRDAGWGKLVYQGKDIDHHFSDELVGACVNLIREWNILPAPEWVTCIPSLRHKELIPDFAQRLSAALGIPFYPVLVKTEERPEQKKMENSSQQARNVDGALAINVKSPPKGPVLLVDDMVDSKWTMTIATWLLRSHGSGEVWPLALALTGHE